VAERRAFLLRVDPELYESAELDGAGPLQRLRWVTLPTISPVILFSVVIGVIAGGEIAGVRFTQDPPSHSHVSAK